MRGFGISLLSRVVALCALFLLAPATGSAAVGDLTAQGCFQDTGPPDTNCDAGENPGLGSAQSVVVSPDGESVYATGLDDHAVSIFKRDTATGALTPDGCITDADNFPGSSGCDDFGEGMNEPFGLAVSPDGLDVYVASTGDDAVAHLERDPDTGGLTPVGCVGAPGDVAGCGGLTQAGLINGKQLVVDPDGTAVYIAAGTGTGGGSVVRLNRNTTNGAISPGACVSDAPDSFGCGAEAEGLDSAYDIAISADGSSLHVAGRNESSVVSLTAPALSPLGCIADTDTPLAGCASTQGLSGVRGVAVSPDGKSVYARSLTDAAVVRFNRTASGMLTAAGCITDREAATNCGGAEADGLAGGTDIAVSPDNASVYAVGGHDDHAIAIFDRSTATGALTDSGCITEIGLTGCEAETNGTAFAAGIVVSPDGKSVYVASTGSSAVTRFDRETEPVEPPPPAVQIRAKRRRVRARARRSRSRSTSRARGDSGSAARRRTSTRRARWAATARPSHRQLCGERAGAS